MGALLALTLPNIRVFGTGLGAGLTGAGLIAIAVAVMAFAEGTPFPGLAALLPTLGATAIIAGAWLAPHSPFARLLSTPAFVGIGLLSYSWYLWHWPLLALARAHDLGVRDVWRDSAIAGAALGLAWLTYVYVEHPIRSRKVWSGWSKVRVIGAAATSCLALVVAAHALRAHASQLAKTDHYVRVAEAYEDVRQRSKRCFHENNQRFANSYPLQDA